MKTKHQCTFVYINNFTHFYQLLGILLICDLVSHILTIYLRGSEVCLKICDLYSNFGYLKKIKKIYLKRNLYKNTLSLYWNHGIASLHTQSPMNLLKMPNHNQYTLRNQNIPKKMHTIPKNTPTQHNIPLSPLYIPTCVSQHKLKEPKNS